MKVDQLSIFLENRAGRLAEVTRILAESGVNIRALSLADTSDFGILRLIVSDFEKAKENLKAGGFTVGRTTVVAVGSEGTSPADCTASWKCCATPRSMWSTCTRS